jgi:uncharacterized phiE125 gp8 family phage protein
VAWSNTASVWDHLALVTPPPSDASGLLVSVAEAMVQCRATPQPGGPFDETSWFEDALWSAQAEVEGPRGAGIALLTQQWRLSVDVWPEDYVVIPIPPVVSVDQITYLPFGSNQGDAYLTLDPSQYVFDLDADPVHVRRAFGVVWPILAIVPGAVKITFTTGFADTVADFPVQHRRLKSAIKLLVAHWYAHREAVVGVDARDSSTPLPLGVDFILDKYRVGRLG